MAPGSSAVAARTRRPSGLSAVAAPLTLLLPLLWGSPCGAELPGSPRSEAGSSREGRVPRVIARSETFLQLFRRALLPGPNGALVESETVLPLHEYVLVQGRGAEVPFAPGVLDFELSAFGRLFLVAPRDQPRFDGDVQTANVRYHTGPLSLRLGRQQVAGGAARFARFDGVSAGVNHPSGLFGEAYAGFTVLPRWNERPGYHHLGTFEDQLTREVEDLPRRRYWLYGARAGYATHAFQGSLSFHEAREQAVGQRNLGLDLASQPSAWANAGGSVLLELDSGRLARARLFVDARPSPSVDLGAELFHAEPALLLSRQSVLSVFSTDGYEELGGTLGLRPWSSLRLEAAVYGAAYSAGELGGRAELSARFNVDRATYARMTYMRVLAPENGYHSLRTSLRRELFLRCASTLEAYGYFYDEPIMGRRVSSVYAGTLSYRALDALDLLLGASLAESPYAALDAQALFRATYELDAGSPGFR